MSFAGKAFILAQWEISAMHTLLEEENQKDCLGRSRRTDADPNRNRTKSWERQLMKEKNNNYIHIYKRLDVSLLKWSHFQFVTDQSAQKLSN